MHRCSSPHCNTTVGPCSCGVFHPHQGSSFSMLFSMANHNPIDEMDTYPITSSSASVDCTLSLGTPSTRQTEDKSIGRHRRSGSSCMSNLCWDIFQTKQPPQSSVTHKSSRGGSSNTGAVLNNLNGDPLLARRCANCDTTSTPLWRNGPRGPKSLCNACGIRYKKEEKRATTTTNSTAAASALLMEPQQFMSHQYHSWTHHIQTQKIASMSPALGNEFRFIEDDDRDSSTTGIPFLSWRLNVPDRPSLVHDYT
ncbi:PREDICTED: GATA transcription factor 18-like [Nelumbo nucifera]|uniref:GATA transcription factor 18-like n=2 Tax=Nelumbo nucifera TaxID=4432 RepID=A0A1U7ZS03_NELNU|nr:PREDICTED: GATA transcription factor 18-like [Nelumbo nucifera]DAD40742.1 TPA_asm: hypothetical protein HUJ06_015065 [Nelumbo nucifera]